MLYGIVEHIILLCTSNMKKYLIAVCTHNIGVCQGLGLDHPLDE